MLEERYRRSLELWFPAVAASTGATSKSTAIISTKLISVLDSKRTQIILIVLGKIKQRPEAITNLIIELDVTALGHELTCSLVDILPTEEELTAVSAYSDPLLLDQASQMLFYFHRIPRLALRIDMHETAFSWDSRADAVGSKLSLLHRACEELNISHPYISRVMSIVLAVGNYINGNTARGQAYGVEIEVLDKIPLMKSTPTPQAGIPWEAVPVIPAPPSTSLIHFIVAVLESEAPDLLQVASDWLFVRLATEIPLKQLQGDIAQLESQLEKVKKEYGFQRELIETAARRAIAKTAIETTETEVSTIDSHSDALSTTTSSSAVVPTADDNNVQLSEMAELSDHDIHCAKRLLARLQPFVTSARDRLESLKIIMNNVNIKMEKLMNLYGESLEGGGNHDGGGAESDGGDACKTFFTMIYNFMNNISKIGYENTVKRKNDERNKRLAIAEIERKELRQKELERRKINAALIATQDSNLLPSIGHVETDISNMADNTGEMTNLAESESSTIDSSGREICLETFFRSLESNQLEPGTADITENIQPAFVPRSRRVSNAVPMEKDEMNIFDRFHTAQDVSSDEVADHYTMKLKQLAQNQSNQSNQSNPSN